MSLFDIFARIKESGKEVKKMLCCPHCGMETEKVKSSCFEMFYKSGSTIGFSVACCCGMWYAVEYGYGRVTVKEGENGEALYL